MSTARIESSSTVRHDRSLLRTRLSYRLSVMRVFVAPITARAPHDSRGGDRATSLLLANPEPVRSLLRVLQVSLSGVTEVCVMCVTVT